MDPYLQHFIFFVTYEWAQYVRMFVPGKSYQPSEMWQSIFQVNL